MRRIFAVCGLIASVIGLNACAVLNPWPKPANYDECHRTQEGKCQNILSAYEESLAFGGGTNSPSGTKSGGEIRPTAKSPASAGPGQEGLPIRKPGKVLRVEIFPYIDDKGRWHGGEYVFMEVEKSQWADR